MGSGRHNQGGKDTINRRQNLDVRQLQRKGLLTAGKSFSWHWTRDGESAGSIQVRPEGGKLTLIYRHKHEERDWQSIKHPVCLEWTECNYGGRRAWVICPTIGCGRRVALLYIDEKGFFACRHCQRLVYECQRENADNRASQRADKIRERLRWEPGILNGPGIKPKGMYWQTFERLTSKHDAFVRISVSMARRLQMIEAGLGHMVEDLNLFRKNDR